MERLVSVTEGHIKTYMLTRNSCLLIQQPLIRLNFRRLTEVALQVTVKPGYIPVNNMGVNW